MINKIKKQLFELQDEKYKKFSSKLLPSINSILGIRLPELRQIAKEIYKNNETTNFIQQNTGEYFELIMIEGMVINLIDDYSTAIKYTQNFIKKINNWSVCDSFCCGLKIVKKNKKEFKAFLEKYFNSNMEYELRFAYVILLSHFVDDDFNYVSDKILKFNNDAYYAKMAVAWLLSVCFVKHFDQTLDFIKNNEIHNFVLKKGIIKSRESYRLNKEQKDILKNLYLTAKNYN